MRSRIGAIPIPTVKVRIGKEIENNKTATQYGVALALCFVFRAVVDAPWKRGVFYCKETKGDGQVWNELKNRKKKRKRKRKR